MHYIRKLILFLMVLSLTLTAFAATPLIKSNSKLVHVPNGVIWYKKYYTDNTKNKIPLIIVNGGPGLPHNYLNILRLLAVDRPIIFYDQLGCGYSKALHPNKNLWQINQYEKELTILINSLHVKQVDLFGHSWGGALAVTYTLKNTAKVKSLILASPLLSTPLWMLDSRILIKKLPEKVQYIINENEHAGTTNSIAYQQAMIIFYRHFLCRMTPWPQDLNYSLDHMNTDIYHAMWGPSEFTVTGNLKNFDCINSLKKLTIPVLITGGKFDEARPDTLKLALKQLSHGQLIIYEKSAHMAFIEENKKYDHDLTVFLDEHGS